MATASLDIAKTPARPIAPAAPPEASAAGGPGASLVGLTRAGLAERLGQIGVPERERRMGQADQRGTENAGGGFGPCRGGDRARRGFRDVERRRRHGSSLSGVSPLI